MPCHGPTVLKGICPHVESVDEPMVFVYMRYSHDSADVLDAEGCIVVPAQMTHNTQSSYVPR